MTLRGDGTTYDVVVVGAGVVGCAIARLLSHHELRVAVVEATADVGTGTTKANTAILHTGFDAKVGTLEARLVHDGYHLLRAYSQEAGIPVETIGALLVAWDGEQASRLDEIAANSRRNGYTAVRGVSAEEMRRREPHLGEGAVAGLLIPDEGIICSWTTAFAFATEAIRNGAEFFFRSRVTGLRREEATGDHIVETGRGPLRSRWLINAAGLYSDDIDRAAGYDRFQVTPRRGQLIVYDKLSRRLVNHVLLPVPTATTKGVLVAPTIYGNVLLGPTAEDLQDKTDTRTTAAGLDGLIAKGRTILPELVQEEITAVYAGLRAATEHADYQVYVDGADRYAVAGGIRSTGLSSSMALADHIVRGLGEAGLPLVPARDMAPVVPMPNIGEASPRPYQRADLIAQRADYGRILCHCERVTRGEIIDATQGPLPCSDLDGLRRRTRCLMGRCQGFFCLPTVARTFADATGGSMEDLLGDGSGEAGEPSTARTA